jgi:hypothetical protein
LFDGALLNLFQNTKGDNVDSYSLLGVHVCLRLPISGARRFSMPGVLHSIIPT